MTPTPPSTTPPDPASTADDDRYYHHILHAFIEAGAMLLDDLVQQQIPAAAKADPYERFSRAARRSILLARDIAQHPLQAAQPAAASPPETTPEQRRAAARTRILREVEDRIEAKADTEEHAETLRAELRERLDDLDASDDILTRPIPEQIEEIRRDLGVADHPFNLRYRRRTPEDVRALRDFAEAPPAPERCAPGPCAIETPLLKVVRDG